MINRIDLNEKDFLDEVKQITAAFSEVLSIQNVEPTDNFFQLGGDSFDAIRVMSKLDGDLHVVTLFENPTADLLAKYRFYKTEEHRARLVSLNNSSKKNGSVAVICVPFGGGDPTAYKSLFSNKENVNVYGVDFGDIEIENALGFSGLVDVLVTEIKKIDADQFVIYGHCAGAATAACIASALKSVIHSVSLVVAAARPIVDSKDAITQCKKTSDDEWSQYLRSLGAFAGLAEVETRGMLRRGRRDHMIAIEAYRSLTDKPADKVPTLVLLGDNDPVTVESKQVIDQWQAFSQVVRSASLVDAGHYFIRTHVSEVTDAVLNFMEQYKKRGRAE